MSSGLRDEDRILASKIITLVHDLDAIAVERRLADNDAARNCADTARALCELEQRSPSGIIELLVFDSEKPVGVYWGSKVSTWLNEVCKM